MSRNTTDWYQTLVKAIKQNPTIVARWEKEERGRIAKLIVHVELGLSLRGTFNQL